MSSKTGLVFMAVLLNFLVVSSVNAGPRQDVSIQVSKDEPFCSGQSVVLLKNTNESSRVVATIRSEALRSVLPDLVYDRFFNPLSPVREPKTYPVLLLPGEEQRLSCGLNTLPDGKMKYTLLGAYYPIADMAPLETMTPEDSIVLRLDQSPQAIDSCKHSSITNPPPTGTYAAFNMHPTHTVAIKVTNKTPKSLNGFVSVKPFTYESVACIHEVLLKNVTLDEFVFIRQ